MMHLVQRSLAASAIAAALTLLATSAAAAPRDLARCLIKRDLAGARAFGVARPGSAADEMAASRLARTCDDPAGDLTDPGKRLLVGGAIAEQLFGRETRNLYARRFQPAADARLDATSERRLQAAREWPGNVAVVSCATARDPQAAYLLLRTKPESAREASAAQALAPSIAACVGRGERMALNRPVVRAIVARYFLSDGFAGDWATASR